MNKKSGVGLLLVTDVPGIGRVAALQVRGHFNTEEMRPQYFAGGCQVTVYGGVKKGETLKQALAREVKEELGLEMVKVLKRRRMIPLVKFQRANEEGIIYAAFLNFQLIKKIRLSIDSGGLRFVKPSELKKALDLSKFKSGVKNRFALAVFPDMRHLFQKVFKIFPQN